MKIIINRINDAVNLEAINDTGNSVVMDGSPDIGGLNLGMRPMQLLLVALGGCTSMDMLSILKKMKQDVKGYTVEVDGERVPEGDVSLFRNIHLKYILKGELDNDKVERAISLSMDKYCSVSKTLEPTAKITFSYEIIS